MLLSERLPLEERSYIVQDRGDDYLAAVIGTDWETMPFEFKWTPDKRKAKPFRYGDLHARETLSLMARIIRGHSGARAIRVI